MFLKRRTQISESHCGPAVVEMLLSNLGIERTQEEIAQAAGVVNTIEEHGARVDQLALAISKLVPHVLLYYKQYASLSDIDTLLSVYNLPVGVEWQGLFYEREEDEEEDDEEDFGHYSVITHIDYEKKAIIIVDPYKDYASSDRIIDIYKFLNRWWDDNEIKDPQTGKRKYIRDEKPLFVISQRNPELSEKLNLKAYF
jgi:hypothetical protein